MKKETNQLTKSEGIKIANISDKYSCLPANSPRATSLMREEKNQKILGCIMDLGKLPKIDMQDPKAVQKRIWEYYEFCHENSLPLEINTFAVALGITRGAIDRYISGKINAHSTAPLLAEAKQMIEAHTESALDQDAINMAYGIFKSKALFGYQENSTITVENKNSINPKKTEEELRQEFVDNLEPADYEVEDVK